MRHHTHLLLSALALAALLAACDDPKKQADAPACAEGEQGCACVDGQSCLAGLQCINNLCIPEDDPDLGSPDMSDPDMDAPDADAPDADAPDADAPDMDSPDMVEPPVEGAGLEVDQAQVRGCEVVLRDPDEAIRAVRFAGGLQGRFLRRGERLALAFTATDSPGPGAVSFDLRQGSDFDAVQVMLGRCVDGDGAALPQASVTLRQAN